MKEDVMSEAYWEALLADADRAQAEAYEEAYEEALEALEALEAI